MLRERKKLNQKGGLLTTLALVGAGIGLAVAVTDGNEAIYNAMRFVFLWLDGAIYSAAGWAYSIFYEVSYSSILSTLNLSTAAQRLYTLLGIFMLFRLAFAFVKYIINPDGMEKGSGKLMTNLAVSLALIVSTPWIFNRAFELQTYIMDSNVIGNLIMGMNTNTAEDDNFNAGSYGQVVSFLTFSAFYHPDASIPAISSCGNLLNYYSEFVKITEDDKLSANYAGTDAQNKEAEKIAACVNELNGENDSSLDNNSVEIGTRFFIASQRYSMSLIAHPGVYKAEIGEQHVITYTPIVSTIAGGFLALLFLNFCFDVAVRNVKLCFLQIIAPIPIILNIEPGDSKNKPLSWWGKECLRTYVDLFIRVATVYFGVFLINQLFGNGMTVNGSTNTSAWFKVFMILGILLFVKQIPEMIGKAFGIDMKGNFSLNPLKRIGENRLASMALGGAAGLATGLIGGAYAGYRGARSSGANYGAAIKSAVTGSLGGGLHSMWTGGKTGAKTLGGMWSNTRQNMARSGHIAAANQGTTWSERMRASLAMATGIPTAADVDKRVIDATKQVGTLHSAAKSRAASEIMKKNGAEVKFNGSTSVSLGNFARTKGATDAVFDNTVAGHETFKVYDASTGRYRSAGSDGYTIGSYKAELAAYDNAKNLDTSTMTNAQRRTHAARLAEWERGLGLKKKFIEGESAIEWGYVNDDYTKAYIDQLDDHIKSNSDIFANERLMGAGRTITSFDIHNQKPAIDNAEYVASTHSSTEAARRHSRALEAAKAKKGGK